MYEKSRHKVMNEHQREACPRGEGIADAGKRGASNEGRLSLASPFEV